MSVIDKRQKHMADRTGGFYNVEAGCVAAAGCRPGDRLELPDGGFRIVGDDTGCVEAAVRLDRPVPCSPANRGWEEIGYGEPEDVRDGDFLRIVFWGFHLEGFVLGLDRACAGDPGCVSIAFEPDGIPAATVYLDNCAGIRLWRRKNETGKETR